jgi:hypothetical protein
MSTRNWGETPGRLLPEQQIDLVIRISSASQGFLNRHGPIRDEQIEQRTQ